MSDDIVDRLNITADMISLGDKIRYGSDSQIMREAADEIEKLRAALAEEKQCRDRENRRKRMYYFEVSAADKVIAELRTENVKLRAALKPFAGMAQYCEGMSDSESHCVLVGDLRAAAAALKEAE